MKLLQAATYLGPIKFGGSTKPWIVQTYDGSIWGSYVVKLFTPKQTKQIYPIAKEVFGNALAQEFDLNVPNYALFEFSSAFIESLPERERARISEISSGLKFGTALIENAPVVNISQQRSLLKSYDIGTIFAFDNLVWNLDRGGARNKPNLLIDDETLILIDHEQIFPFSNDTLAPDAYVIPPFEQSAWYYPYDKHLFHSLLTKLPPAEKVNVFDTFQYFLENLSLSAMDSVASELEQLGIEIGNYPVVRKHLLQTKARAGEFCQFLITLIA